MRVPEGLVDLRRATRPCPCARTTKAIVPYALTGIEGALWSNWDRDIGRPEQPLGDRERGSQAVPTTTKTSPTLAFVGRLHGTRLGGCTTPLRDRPDRRIAE